MKTLSTKSKLIALIALVAIASVSVAIRVRAQTDTAPPEPDRRVPLFGMTGITRTQTARINVANLSQPPEPDLPPDPCRVVMAFVDADGDVLRTSDGQPVVRQVMLQAGHAAFLQINGSEFVGSEGTRINFRPLVRVFTTLPDLDRAIPPDPCVPTLEIIENGTGRTSLLFAGTPNLQPPPEPDRQ